jgi:predicted lipoprotein with Yx(FWY)xxD motif
MKRSASLAVLALSALALAFVATPARAGYSGQPQVRQTDSGTFLADPDGTPLYTYEFDKSGHSNCINTCTLSWPPEQAADNAAPSGRFGIIDRNDGRRQWTYDGMPLYGFSYDTKGGKPNGDNINGFHLAMAD